MKKIFFYLIIFLVVIVAGGYIYYNSWYNSALNYTLSDSNKTVEFIVEQGESTDSITSKLKESGLIKDVQAFKWYLKRENKGGSIQAGTFQIPENSNMEAIVTILGNAQNPNVLRVTIIEGHRLTQIKQTLTKAFSGKPGAIFSEVEFDTMTKSPNSYTLDPEITEFLLKYKPINNSLEGFMYPDTYEFKNTATTQEVVERLVKEFMSKVENLEKGDDFYDKLVLASIIERESATNEEKDEISSVFTNRLAAGMALESDATINYATGKSDPRPSYEDLEIISPYNTYRYPGLPPTPICSPRIEAIEAALNPADTDYYYFIHEQDGSGQVHFAKTLSEHNSNVSKYLD